MANPFLQNPFDKLADDLNGEANAPLPGQRAAAPTQQAPDVTRASTPAAETPTAAPAAESTPELETRRPTKVNNWLPPADMQRSFDAAAQKYDVPVNVLMALGHQESRYNTSAVGPETKWGRARGSMQYLDSTAKNLGINPMDADQSINAAALQIRQRLDKGYSMPDAVMEHFAGPDRKLWGAKTAVYGREVMGKATTIGNLMTGGAAGPTAQPVKTATDTPIPADWKRLTEAQAAEIEAKQGKKPVDEFTALAAQQRADGATFGAGVSDVGKNLKIGLNSTAQDLRELVGRIPLVGQPFVKGMDAIDQYATGKTSDQILAGDTEAMKKTLTPQMQGALEKKWWDSEKSAFGPAWSDWRSYSGGLTQSLPAQALTMVPAMRLAKYAYAGKVAAGATVEVASAAAARTAMIAGGISEGLLGGASSAREVRTAVNELKPEILAQSDAYKSLLSSGMTPDAARTALAEDLSTGAFVTSGLITGVFGGLGDRTIAKLFTERVGGSVIKNTLKNLVKGGIAEGVLEELPQSLGQAVSQNVAIGVADPTRKIGDDVINQGLGGMAIGGLQGGAMGAASGARRTTPQTGPGPAPGPTPAQGPAPTPPPAPQPAPQPVPPTQVQPAPADAAPPAPPTGKPLGDSVTNAAEAPKRVILTAEDGEIAGTLQAYQEDGNGGYIAQVVGDDGQVYEITDQDGVQITPVAPAPGPLTGAIEQAAEEVAAQPEIPVLNDVLVSGEDYNSISVLTEMIEPVAPVDPTTKDSLVVQPAPEAINEVAPAVEPAAQAPAAAVPTPAAEAKPKEPKNPYLTQQFPDQGKADAFIAKNGISDGYEVEQTGKGRFQIKPIAAGVKPSLTTEVVSAAPVISEAAPAISEAPAVVSEAATDTTTARKMADDFAIRPVEISEHLIATGGMKALHKAAGVRSADAFNGLPMDDQAKAYAKYVADGGQAAPAATEAYDDMAMRLEREALVRRLQSDSTVQQANGRPFKTVASAQQFSTQNDLTDTHEVSPSGSGFILKRLGAARRPSAIKAAADRYDNDPETIRQEAAFARATKIGGKAAEAMSDYQNSDTSIDQFEAQIDTAASAPAPRPAAPAPSPATPAPAKKLTGKAKIADTERRLAEHFTPGNVIKSYSGNDRVISYTAPDANGGGFAVRVQAVVQKDGQWAPAKNERERSHSTRPTDAEMKNGVVERAAPAKVPEVAPTMLQESPYAATPALTETAQITERALTKIFYASDREEISLAAQYLKSQVDSGAVTADEALRRMNEAAKANPSDLDQVMRAIDTLYGEKGGKFLGAAPMPRTPGIAAPVAEKVPELAPPAPPASEAPASAPPPAGMFDDNKLFTADKVAAARARMKSKLNQLNSGLDPELVVDGMTLAGAYIEAGTRKFSAYAKAMVDDFGPKIQPFLLSFYEAVRHYPGLDTDGMSTPETAKKQHDAMLMDAPAAEAEPAAPAAAPVAATETPADDGELFAKTETVSTPSGREFEVRHKIVEAADLTTSNRDDGSINPDFPQDLQPRDRTRQASQGQVNDIAAKLNPRLLGESASATDGAPIVSSAGIVESGNGRTMAIRRAYERNLPGAAKYRAWLAAQGYEVDGMTAPVLVRERVTPMTNAELRAYTQESNDRTTLDLSPTERAMSDAEKIGPIMSQYIGGEIDLAGNRPFIRAFVQDVAAASDRGGLMDANGMLSQGGKRRIEAAMLAAAYDDAAVVADLFESTDSDIKSIGGALLDVSGDWAKMRDESRSGAISSGIDVTKNLIEAVNVVRRARAEGRPVLEFVNQDDIFTGGMDPLTKDFLSVFYRGDSMNRARSRDRVAEALRFYSTQARQSKPGTNLFGDPEQSGADLMKATNDRTKAQDGQANQQQDIFASARPDDQDAGQPGAAGSGSRTGAQGQTTPEGEVNVSGTNASVERDSPVTGAVSAVGDPVSDESGATDGSNAGNGSEPGSAGRGRKNDPIIPVDGPVVVGERGNQQFPGGKPGGEPAQFTAGINDGERSGDAGIAGVPPESIPAAQVRATAATGVSDAEKRIEQRAADKVKTATGIENIRATLPYLMPAQQDDVLKAETRLAKPDGYGILFTNGTGTGKTFTALGVIKRHARDGKTNILIVVPDDKIASDWIESGRALDLDITALRDTKDAGKGITITSYANLGANDALASRQWDLVVPDESHMLMQDKDGTPTSYLHNLRAITNHPDGAYTRFAMLNRADLAMTKQLSEELAFLETDISAPDTMAERSADLEGQRDAKRKVFDKLNAKLQAARDANKAAVEAAQGAGRTRAVFLSATPFAYEKTIDWANGYLFDYNDGRQSEKSEFRGYNQGSNREQFFMQHLGYQMRTNKLSAPSDPKLDRGVLQRQFNGMLKKAGSLSGRMLDVPFDYDRRFVSVDSAIGTRIDDALAWLGENARGEKSEGVQALRDHIEENFNYLSRRYLLEAIKATEAVPIVKQHLALGRKVVVFHDYKKGGGFNPFDVNAGKVAAGNQEIAGPINEAVAQFRREFKDLVSMPFSAMKSPIETFSKEFPDVLLVNGDEKKADLLKRYKSFQDDANGPQVMLVQSAKNKGWSGHDTTGKHQRVLINLGQPTQPTLSIQQEGRVYRTGQASDAIFRYLNTGTNWEKWAFATTIATRASAAENLGMGELSRALKDSYIAAFEESDTYAPGHEGEGKGGKERDKASNESITEYDRAKAFYRATQKKNAKTKAQEGADYYATPEPVGLKMVHWLDSRGGEDTMEPSGGHGAIARWLPENTNRTVIEPSLALRSRMAMVLNGESIKIVDSQFEDLNTINKFDGIAMNPPFGVGGKLAIEHLAKAAQHLRNGGRVVAIIPTGPSADKRFDKWFFESIERPLKPLYTHPTMGPVYRGDTITTNVDWAKTGTVAKISAEGGIELKIAGSMGNTRVNLLNLRSVQPTGPRTETFNPAADLHLIADIKLPSVTFERAGTKVATRIVVIEKQSDAKLAPTRATISRDLTDIDSINELFERMENMDLPARTKPVEAVAPAPAARAPAARPASARPVSTTPTGPAQTEIVRGDNPIVSVFTKAGKEIRGVIRPDMTPAQAKAIDPFSWVPMIDGKRAAGPFIRERHLIDPVAKSSIGGATEVTQQEHDAVQEAVEGKSALDVTNWLAQNAPNPEHRVVADKVAQAMSKMTSDGAEFTFRVAHIGDVAHSDLAHALGVTHFGLTEDRTIKVDVSVNGADVSGRAGTSYETILHEMVHAVTVAGLEFGARKQFRDSSLAIAAEDLADIRQLVMREVRNRIDAGTATRFEKRLQSRANNSMADVHEIVAWSLTNRDMQKLMESIKTGPKTLWSKFVSAVRRMLGLNESSDSALSDVLRISEEIMGTSLTSYAKDLAFDPDLSIVEPSGTKTAGMSVTKEMRDQYSNRPEDAFTDLTDPQKDFLRKIGPVPVKTKLAERWRQLTDNLALRARQAGVDRYAALFENDKALYGADTLEGSIASSSWVLARMSASAAGAVTALLDTGRIYLDKTQKVIDILPGTQGLSATLRTLGSPAEIDRFMGWIAANRARKLLGEGRENLFTEAEIVAAIKLSSGRLANGKSRGIAYAKAWKEFQQIRDDVLGIAEQAGIITPIQRETWAEEFYVPFYRVLDQENEGVSMSFGGSSGLSRQQAYKKLKGGKQHLNDLLENTLLNFHHLLQASLKNQAALQAVENALNLGMAAPTTEMKRDKKASTFVMDGGEKRWYNINDPLTFKALSALMDGGLNNPVMKAGRAFKRFYTNMTTATPQFIVANALRDTLSAMATAPTSPVPFYTAISGTGTYLTGDNKARMMASGGAFSFGHVYGSTPDDVKASMSGQMRANGVALNPMLIPNAVAATWRGWKRVTDVSENANRAGIWQRNIHKGKLKASFEARDLMDFSAHGDAIIVRIVTDLVPFVNARIQGLDKLYRSGIKPGAKVIAGKGTKADRQAFARFAIVAGALSLVSMALFLNNYDDEEYRKLEDWQRDSYWVVRVGDSMYFMPKPFEVGSIATLAERALEQFIDPSVGGSKFASRLGHIIAETFAMNPIPQMVKPLYELGANKNSFTGRKIEQPGMERLSPSLRSTPSTTRLAEGASLAMESTMRLAGLDQAALSPLQIDHLIAGYTGQIGSSSVAILDTMWRSMRGEQSPDKKWIEYQPIKRFYKDLSIEDNYTRYGTDFYNALEKSSRAYANVQHMQKMGELERAEQDIKRDTTLLGNRRMLTQVNGHLSKINAMMKQVQRDTNMDGADKRKRLDDLRAMRNQATKQVVQVMEANRMKPD